MKVEIDMNTLLDFLDQSEGGRLYPEMGKEDTIIRVNINPITAEFVIGKRHSPYTLQNKSKGVTKSL